MTLNVFEHLIDLDKDGTLVPRLATGWRWLDDRTLEVTLRQGVTFHNGEVFDAEIVKLNWEENIRLRQPHAWGVYELQTRVTPGDHRSVHGAVCVSGTGRRGDGQAHPHAYRQPPVLSRSSAGVRSIGELSMALARGAQVRISWWKAFSIPEKRSDRVVLEANLDYWDPTRLPRLQRIVFDNTLAQKDAVELVKTGEGRVDLVTELSPLETLRVAQSPFARVVKNRGTLITVFGQFNMRKTGSPWRDVRLRQAVNLAINREDLIRYATKGNGVIIPALISVHGVRA